MLNFGVFFMIKIIRYESKKKCVSNCFFHQLFYQKGDIRLELNLEYRFDIFKVPFFAGKLEGAIFTDAGNIWLLKADGFRDNAEISGDFHKQIAVAGGWGLRFDFDFFFFTISLSCFFTCCCSISPSPAISSSGAAATGTRSCLHFLITSCSAH